MKRAAIVLAGALLLLIVALAFKGALVGVPEVGTAAPGAFDTAQAMARLQRILGDQRPHPVDTPADDAVRARLVAELRAIGLAPQVTNDWACNGSPKSRAVSCARVRNVVATIGPAAGPHLLIASHYDSTPAGPGAADDGIGVATALEVAALLKDRKLARPVTFLFDEGEEAGLLGAKAFLEHDPVAPRVDAAVNLEARGVTGPAIMFETSRPNGSALAHFARSATRPVANSLTADIYRLIPNATDVTVFAARPWTMLNFAIIGNETRYHSPGDTLAALDPRSVHHMGIQALAAAQELASAPVAAGKGERLYADLLGRGLVSLPLAAGLTLLAALLLFAGWNAWRRRAGIGRAVAAVLAALVGSGAATFLLQAGIGLVRPGEYMRAHPEVIAVAVDLAAVAASLAMLVRLARPLARDRLRAAFWLVFLLLGTGLAVVAPGTSIFFLAPPLLAFAGIALERRLPGAERVAALLAWAALFLSWAPLLHLGEVLLGFVGSWIFALVAALIVLPVLIEMKPLLVRVPARLSLGGIAAAAVAAWIAVALAPAYSPDRKQQFRIEYGWDAGKRSGQWAVLTDGAPLPGLFKGFDEGVKVPWSTAKRSTAGAPPLPLPPPRVEVLAERPTPAGRLLTLRLASGGVEAVLLRAEPEAGLRAVRVAGSYAAFGKGGKKDPFFLRCQGRSCDGAVIDLLVAGPKPAELTLVGIRSGLPAAAAPLVRARPADAQPQYAPDQSYAVVRLRVRAGP
ncbi:MAG TPA: M20/M25/M40 family metallo-hydrolase [Allosphingosinicella sp.]|jgi:hypothetical protein